MKLGVLLIQFTFLKDPFLPAGKSTISTSSRALIFGLFIQKGNWCPSNGPFNLLFIAFNRNIQPFLLVSDLWAVEVAQNYIAFLKKEKKKGFRCMKASCVVMLLMHEALFCFAPTWTMCPNEPCLARGDTCTVVVQRASRLQEGPGWAAGPGTASCYSLDAQVLWRLNLTPNVFLLVSAVKLPEMATWEQRPPNEMQFCWNCFCLLVCLFAFTLAPTDPTYFL